jgi:hypothetical protein
MESLSMRDLLHDVIVAVRRLKAARGFTAFSILTLAIGIGMTTAIYALVKWHDSAAPPHSRYRYRRQYLPLECVWSIDALIAS